eukprot:Phypoly_transcript_14438.p1 GENE.Phypoly_transcript_14438~~Phypoly_transcript_14438.p1  ORF type:complete len:264 (+),score=36.46 Phypoly_transcript_14438:56-847(+)
MDVEEQARAISAFGSKVFHGLFQGNHNISVAVSPLALGMVLMAATSGAEGETKRELLDTFHISTLDLESCQSLIRSSTKSHNMLDIATSLWFEKSYDIKKDFVSNCEDSFHTTAKNVDDLEDINRWVTSSTHGKLRKVIDPTPKSQPLTAVNCVYFHGTWKREFTEIPSEKKFTSVSGSRECSMMKQTATLPYLKTDTFQAVEVPYCDRFVATVILPEKSGEQGVQEVMNYLRDVDSWKKFVDQLAPKSVTVSLPQFKMEWQK